MTGSGAADMSSGFSRLLGGAATATLFALLKQPVTMALWLAPVVLFSVCALLAKRRRNRPLYLLCVFFSAVTALFAAVAAMTPAG